MGVDSCWRSNWIFKYFQAICQHSIVCQPQRLKHTDENYYDPLVQFHAVAAKAVDVVELCYFTNRTPMLETNWRRSSASTSATTLSTQKTYLPTYGLAAVMLTEQQCWFCRILLDFRPTNSWELINLLANHSGTARFNTCCIKQHRIVQIIRIINWWVVFGLHATSFIAFFSFCAGQLERLVINAIFGWKRIVWHSIVYWFNRYISFPYL